jgi:hypothetical protein
MADDTSNELTGQIIGLDNYVTFVCTILQETAAVYAGIYVRPSRGVRSSEVIFMAE